MNDTSTMPGRLHLKYVDGLRALAALFVVCHHIWLTVWPILRGQHATGIVNMLGGWLLYGHFAVTLFIVISGFSLMISVVRANGVLKGGTAFFFRKRIRRILPTYYAALGLSWLLVQTLLGTPLGSHWDVCLPVTRGGLLAHLLLIHDLNSPWFTQYNASLWSIAVEFHIYFLFPLLVWLWRRIGACSSLACAFVVSYGLEMSIKNTTLQYAHIYYVALFAMGMLAATIVFSEQTRWQKWREAVPWSFLALACSVVTGYLCLYWGWDKVNARILWLDALVGVGSVALLVAASQPSPLQRFLCARPLVFVGGMSYSLYLIHAPIMEMLWRFVCRPLHLGPNTTFMLLLVISLPVLLIVAYCFHIIFERPFMSSPSPKSKRQAENTVVVPVEQAASV